MHIVMPPASHSTTIDRSKQSSSFPLLPPYKLCAAGAEPDSTSGICVGDTGSALFVPGKTAAEDLLVRFVKGCAMCPCSGFEVLTCCY